MVVGTTSDYIDIINRRFPGRAVFLTDAAERAGAKEPAPPEPDELVCDLSRGDDAVSQLRSHLERWRIRLRGIVCFDCESMQLSSKIARELSLPYVSSEAVSACRNKFASKTIWREAGLPCPRAELVKDVTEARQFLERSPCGAVIKPVAGSGSEYVFLCANKRECASAIRTMNRKLAELRKNPRKPLYSRDHSTPERGFYVMEEFVLGAEFSCDFIIFGKRLEILRLAQKVPARGRAFGTTLAYILPGRLPPSLDINLFRNQLRKAARSLGVERAICMLDFIVRDGEAIMLEMTPRPGGDCLPPLILRSCGMDMLGVAMDFSTGRLPIVPKPPKWRQLVGLRLFATEPGVIERLDASRLQTDKRVVECHVKRGPGDKVLLPPDDYDSQLLGYVIFKPSVPDNIEDECLELADMLKLKMEKTWPKILRRS